MLCPCCKKEMPIRMDRLKVLTPHQQRIAVMWAQGMKPQEIGERLKLQRHCVTVHLTHVRERLPVNDQRELTLYLYGLIEAGADL